MSNPEFGPDEPLFPHQNVGVRVENGFLIPKLRLLEIWPVYPFLGTKSDLTIFDIGANVGLWCQAWMQTFGAQTAAYHAFEPLPGNVRIFEQRLRERRVSNAEKVHLHQICVGEGDGSVVLNSHADVSSTASVLLTEVRIGNKTFHNDMKFACKLTSCDTFIQQTGIAHIDLIKIDVEGYEWLVLQGLRKSLERQLVDMIYFEFGQHQGTVGQSFKMFWEFLNGYGFNWIYRTQHVRNFFGIKHVSRYDPSLEDFGFVWMILASRYRHDEKMNLPFVVGRYRAGEP